MSERDETGANVAPLSEMSAWQQRITEMPTQADIDSCQKLWPDNWQEKNAFFAGQVATALAEIDRLRAELADAEAREAAARETCRGGSGRSVVQLARVIRRWIA